ncbi:hypothetical protein [Pararobbsia silviterrae]|uniref:DUF3325 domain-containing protein n=1 Tax=Pararobbsia silviterrae TaxID=1792498 RepID=A0A494XA99_9BURK|nr:hypothetical protein [Pararobbsia silviterrae]RKP45049.1 hypothetical protein D7S86_26825 [Pararobbsia silviterrae]
MPGLSGTLLALLAGALCYLASPRQQLLPPRARPRLWLGAAALCMAAAIALWCTADGNAAGVCAAVCALAASLAIMPFVGAYWSRDARLRRKTARAGKRRRATEHGAAPREPEAR